MKLKDIIDKYLKELLAEERIYERRRIVAKQNDMFFELRRLTDKHEGMTKAREMLEMALEDCDE